MSFGNGTTSGVTRHVGKGKSGSVVEPPTVEQARRSMVNGQSRPVRTQQANEPANLKCHTWQRGVGASGGGVCLECGGGRPISSCGQYWNRRGVTA